MRKISGNCTAPGGRTSGFGVIHLREDCEFFAVSRQFLGVPMYSVVSNADSEHTCGSSQDMFRIGYIAHNERHRPSVVLNVCVRQTGDT